MDKAVLTEQAQDIHLNFAVMMELFQEYNVEFVFSAEELDTPTHGALLLSLMEAAGPGEIFQEKSRKVLTK